MIIRAMTPNDVPAAAKLERAAFPDPWSEAELRAELEKDFSLAEVKDDGGEIIGYAVSWLVRETAELVRIAAAPRRRREGHAESLLCSALKKARGAGCERVTLEVREGNAAAMGLYGKLGFERIALRRGYYGGEDAVIMERKLDGHTDIGN